MAGKEKDPLKADQDGALRECLAGEERIVERVDEQGVRWRKVYFGGGAHFRNWLEQFKELGEVRVEEVDSKGFRCFEEAGEKLYRVWLKMDGGGLDDLY
ncbi:MAG: hypothetical protein R6V25_07920 [Desulfatiglandales bacterium]